MHILNQMKKRLKRSWLQKYIYLIAGLCVILLFLQLPASTSEEVISESLPYASYAGELQGSLERIPAELIRVVDGDTIVVSIDGEECKIRLIGIDTPESVHFDDSKNNEYGQMASDYAKKLFADQETETVWIEYDQEAEDRYGRQLGYVWLDPDTEDLQHMVNYILVLNGYAVNKEYLPNTRYAGYFQAACQKAMEAGSGLWMYEEFRELW